MQHCPDVECPFKMFFNPPYEASLSWKFSHIRTGFALTDIVKESAKDALIDHSSFIILITFKPLDWICSFKIVLIDYEIILKKLQCCVFSRKQKAYKRSYHENWWLNTSCFTKKLHKASIFSNFYLSLITHLDWGEKVNIFYISVIFFKALNI